ncbi:hypothetical protein M9H77_19246 [Catharanthus roseus]|uniref:Uncharacterized protein n=1 Tax=Catharanthus roseus TaxID=4058 RepID=A0ACC0B9V0_CATRO|nr:hypothetical protein M9H77_19246 [Catharanthus roseus]
MRGMVLLFQRTTALTIREGTPHSWNRHGEAVSDVVAVVGELPCVWNAVWWAMKSYPIFTGPIRFAGESFAPDGRSGDVADQNGPFALLRCVLDGCTVSGCQGDD